MNMRAWLRMLTSAKSFGREPNDVEPQEVGQSCCGDFSAVVAHSSLHEGDAQVEPCSCL